MPELNHQRSIVAYLKEICVRRKITLTGFSGDWIFCLQKNNKLSYVFGYDFGINSASAKMICKDKSATSELLAFHKVPRIEHKIFHGPKLAEYIPTDGSWHEMLEYLNANPLGLVCKPNEGTGGQSVLLARTVPQLESAVYQVFVNSRSLCLSPYEQFENEYRVALLCGKVQFIYSKQRPAIYGDGTRTIKELLIAQLVETADFEAKLAHLKSLTRNNMNWSYIPQHGESVLTNWRHNLGQGSQPKFLSPEESLWESVRDLALKATAALGVELASVDIANTPNGLKVLEINSGIMMESLAKYHPQGNEIAARFYDKIVCLSLGIKEKP